MMLSACFLGSCNNNKKEKVDAHKAKTEVKVKAKKTVHVYSFEGFNKSLGENTLNELKETWCNRQTLWRGCADTNPKLLLNGT